MRKDHRSKIKKEYRVGVVNFINTAPFLIPFKEEGPVEGWHIIEDIPSNLNSMLLKGEIDIGLISSFSYGQNYKKYFVLKDYCISATGTVGSVVLYSRKPIYELSEEIVCLTTQSATSVNLLYIILEYFNNLKPKYIKGNFKDFYQNETVSAYLAIGDEALKIKRRYSGFYVYDLASIWYETTSLPFVFALWAIRKDSGLIGTRELEILRKRLISAYKKGAKNLDMISSMVAGRIPMPQGECLSYLKGIEYDLSALKIKGINHFFHLLKKMKKIKELPEIKEV